jgi:hypothetical protein
MLFFGATAVASYLLPSMIMGCGGFGNQRSKYAASWLGLIADVILGEDL